MELKDKVEKEKISWFWRRKEKSKSMQFFHNRPFLWSLWSTLVRLDLLLAFLNYSFLLLTFLLRTCRRPGFRHSCGNQRVFGFLQFPNNLAFSSSPHWHGSPASPVSRCTRYKLPPSWKSRLLEWLLSNLSLGAISAASRHAKPYKPLILIFPHLLTANHNTMGMYHLTGLTSCVCKINDWHRFRYLTHPPF